MFSWTQKTEGNNGETKIGCFNLQRNHLDIVHTFSNITNCIQATIDDSKTFLGFIIKNIEYGTITYKPYILHIDTKLIVDLEIERPKQIMIQFLYQKTSLLSENKTIKFLIMIHQECKE